MISLSDMCSASTPVIGTKPIGCLRFAKCPKAGGAGRVVFFKGQKAVPWARANRVAASQYFSRRYQAECGLADMESILIVPTDPLHREVEAVLIASFGHKVEVLVGAIEHVNAPPVAGIGVQHVAALALVEDAHALLV